MEDYYIINDDWDFKIMAANHQRAAEIYLEMLIEQSAMYDCMSLFSDTYTVVYRYDDTCQTFTARPGARVTKLGDL